MKRTLAVLAAVPLLLLSGCGAGGSDDAGAGGSSDGTASGGDSSTDTPKCTDIWKVGTTLPADFTGCMEDSTTLLDSSYTPCKDGKTKMFIDQSPTGMNRFVAITGEKIQKYTQSADKKAYDECQPQN